MSKDNLYRWVKASERLPEETVGYAKDLLYRQHLDSGTRLRVSTVNQFLDTVKYRIKEKFEWLEKIEADQQEWEKFATLLKDLTDFDIKRRQTSFSIIQQQYTLIPNKPNV